jgi:hypothetical protein
VNTPDLIEVTAGAQWHRDLLTRMAESTANRKAVLSTEAVRRLADYLGFRHFYRHSYSLYLEWRELEKLMTPLVEVREQTKGELGVFLDTLGSA